MDFNGTPAPDITEFVRANPHAMAPDASFNVPTGGEYLYEKDSAIAAFYMMPVLDKPESKKVGHACYKRVPYIEIRQPGENLNVIRRPVTEIDTMRFRDGWQRFKERMDGEPDGTPLNALFPFHPDIVLTLRTNGCPNIEALADMSDSAVSTLGGRFSEFRDKARKYLIAVTNPDGVKQVQDSQQIEDLKATVKSQSAQIEQMRSVIARLEETQSAIAGMPVAGRAEASAGDKAGGQDIEKSERRGPGRPRKEA